MGDEHQRGQRYHHKDTGYGWTYDQVMSTKQSAMARRQLGNTNERGGG